MNQVNINGFEFSILNDKRFDNFWTHLNSGEWESTTLDIIVNNLSSSDIYIDIGAWIGPTLLAASTTGCQIHAYEPDPIAYKELSENIDNNHLKKVSTHNLALFDKNGFMSFGSGRASELGESVSSLMNGDRGIQVQVRDIKDEVQKEHFKTPKLIKIDTEGAEYVLIPRMSRFLKLHSPMMLLSIHGIKTVGYKGLLGFINLSMNRLNLFKSLSFYRFCYIERRNGWLDGAAKWVRLGWIEKMKLILFVRGNRELLFSMDPPMGSTLLD